MKKITKETMVQYLLIFFIAAIMTMIGNCINTVTDKNPDTFVSILDGIPGLLILMAIALVSSILGFLVPKVPTIVWITIIGILLAMPYNTITGPVVAEQVGKLGLLPLCTPVLAYAGVSIGKDWVEFKRIGWRGILVALLVMVGTYLGSAIVAQIILSAQHII
ncbi:MAG: hypothetical protein HFI31_03045 [Lachnospiraceae bacterium]|jgi:hypothetical protein|nr:hypothetical protein [Lachnospiraceae bacterium]MCI8994414.1 hypothetical protein [Lachnospiraceae bacterium]MCI9133155.1 hypothetical protein [Lachnospiraceae bacterium]